MSPHQTGSGVRPTRHTLWRALAAATSMVAVLGIVGACGGSAQDTAPASTVSVDPALHDRLPEKIKSAGAIMYAIQQHPP